MLLDTRCKRRGSDNLMVTMGLHIGPDRSLSTGWSLALIEAFISKVRCKVRMQSVFKVQFDCKRIHNESLF